MTKTYEQRIVSLDIRSVSGAASVSFTGAVGIAEEADQEIAKLKGLLKEVLTKLETRVSCPLKLAKRVDEALDE